MTRALVTGAAGLLGQHLVRELLKSSEVLAIDLSINPFSRNNKLTYVQGDFLNFDELQPKLKSFAANYIYNCAAYTDVDGCEKNRPLADKLNVELVEKLLGLPYDKFVQFSTDYVFDGKAGPYAEEAPTNPVGYYGLTKLKSETILANYGKPYLIIRSNALYGNAKDIRPNFVSWLIDNLRLGKALKIVTDQYNNPTNAANLAELSIEASGLGYTGILNLGGTDYLSRFEMANIVAKKFGFDKSLIEPITTSMLGQAANRPLRGGLKIDKAKGLLKTRFFGFREGLESIADY